MLRVMPVLLLSFGRRNFVGRSLFHRKMGTRLKHERGVVKKGKHVSKRQEGQGGSHSIRMGSKVGIGIASKNSIWASPLKA